VFLFEKQIFGEGGEGEGCNEEEKTMNNMS
jgi:hypothetical protein